MATEYEQLLTGILTERKTKLESLKAEGKSGSEVDTLVSDIGFVEVELERYRKGLNLFRSKDRLPKVGRWGKPESAPQGEAPA